MEDYRTILRFAKQEKPYIFATLENTTPENAARYAREKANFYTKYHEYIDNYDPYYNPHFNNLFENFGLK